MLCQRVINDVMKKRINGMNTYTRIDLIEHDDTSTRYEIVARCTVHTSDPTVYVDLFVYCGTDYEGVALVINGKKINDKRFSCKLLECYVLYTSIINKYGYHNHVVFDGVFLAELEHTLNS